MIQRHTDKNTDLYTQPAVLSVIFVYQRQMKESHADFFPFPIV